MYLCTTHRVDQSDSLVSKYCTSKSAHAKGMHLKVMKFNGCRRWR